MMTHQNAWDRASDLYGLIKAASFLADDARNNPDAQHGLTAVLNVAQDLAGEVCNDAETAHDAQLRADVDAIEKAKAMLHEKVATPADGGGS